MEQISFLKLCGFDKSRFVLVLNGCSGVPSWCWELVYQPVVSFPVCCDLKNFLTAVLAPSLIPGKLWGRSFIQVQQTETISCQVLKWPLCCSDGWGEVVSNSRKNFINVLARIGLIAWTMSTAEVLPLDELELKWPLDRMADEELKFLGKTCWEYHLFAFLRDLH